MFLLHIYDSSLPFPLPCPLDEELSFISLGVSEICFEGVITFTTVDRGEMLLRASAEEVRALLSGFAP